MLSRLASKFCVQLFLFIYFLLFYLCQFVKLTCFLYYLLFIFLIYSFPTILFVVSLFVYLSQVYFRLLFFFVNIIYCLFLWCLRIHKETTENTFHYKHVVPPLCVFHLLQFWFFSSLKESHKQAPIWQGVSGAYIGHR